MADFKDEFSPALVERLGAEIAGAWPAFPRNEWRARATEGLDGLRLLERVAHLGRVLGDLLPPAFPEAARVLHEALRSETLDGWMTLPCGWMVADRGIDEPEVALPLLAALSPRFSSEGTVRPFIQRHPEITYRHLREWASDPDHEVRRLVSECTRPRLPWAAATADAHRRPAARHRLPRHALRRSLRVRAPIRGEPPQRHIQGPSRGGARLRPPLGGGLHPGGVRRPSRPAHAGQARRPGGARPARLRPRQRGHPRRHRLRALRGRDRRRGDADRRALGRRADPRARSTTWSTTRARRASRPGKVFTLTRRDLRPGRPETIVRRHRFRHVSIRTIRPGRHRIEIQVNGRVLGGCDIEVVRGVTPRAARPQSSRASSRNTGWSAGSGIASKNDFTARPATAR